MTRVSTKASFALLVLFAFLAGGCGADIDVQAFLEGGVRSPVQEKKEDIGLSEYYDQFYKEMTKRARIEEGTTGILALDALPKDPEGLVNWTAAVEGGYISPRGSLDPDVVDEPPLSLNIFIEAKVPLMANVIFPHSIHTYWLSCNNCHPKIFLPEAGANPITMDEIFQGEWCGRCHGKVAFPFWPRVNCIRCHIILKGQSKERESFR